MNRSVSGVPFTMLTLDLGFNHSAHAGLWGGGGRAGSGVSLSPKVGLGLGLLLNNEQGQACTGLGFGLSPAGPNLGNSGPTG
jgi:hypothetical protein